MLKYPLYFVIKNLKMQIFPFNKFACAKSIRMCVCCRNRFPQKTLYRFLADSCQNLTNPSKSTQKIIKPFTPHNLKGVFNNKTPNNNAKQQTLEKATLQKSIGKSFYFCKECLQECLNDEKQFIKTLARAIKAQPQNLKEVQSIAQKWLA